MRITVNRYAYLPVWWVKRDVLNAYKVDLETYVLEIPGSYLVIKRVEPNPLGDFLISGGVTLLTLFGLLYFLSIPGIPFLLYGLLIALALVPLSSPDLRIRVDRNEKVEKLYAWGLVLSAALFSLVLTPLVFFSAGAWALPLLTLINALTAIYLLVKGKKPLRVVAVFPPAEKLQEVTERVRKGKYEKFEVSGTYCFVWDGSS